MFLAGSDPAAKERIGSRARSPHSLRQMIEQQLAQLSTVERADLLLQAYLALGNTLYDRGEPLPARTYLRPGGEVQGVRVWEAELYRLRGELLWQQAAGTSGVGHVAKGASNVDEGEIEASCYQALHIACRQCAKTLELRAAMSVSRLW